MNRSERRRAQRNRRRSRAVAVGVADNVFARHDSLGLDQWEDPATVCPKCGAAWEGELGQLGCCGVWIGFCTALFAGLSLEERMKALATVGDERVHNWYVDGPQEGLFWFGLGSDAEVPPGHVCQEVK